MRKFISLLSAAAMLGSLAIVPITASAEDAFSYDGSGASGWSGATDSRVNASVITDDNGDYTKITTSGNGSGRIFYNLPAAAQLSDNYVIEYDINMNKANGMGRYGQYNQLAFIASDATLDGNDYGAYATEVGSGNTSSNSGQGYVTGVASSVTSLFGITSGLINYDGTGLEPSSDNSGMLSGKWYRVQAAVSGTSTTVTVIDSEGKKYADAEEYTNSASQLAQIAVAVGRGDDYEGPGTVLIDNVRIYEGEAEELTTTGLRGEIPEYSVTFMNGDEEVSTVAVLSGNTVSSSDIPAVPDKEGYIGSWVLEDGTAFTSSTVITGDTTVTAKYTTKIEAAAKGSVLYDAESEEHRISEGTQGAVFRFDVSGSIPEGEEITSASLIVMAAPRSYDGNNNRWANVQVWTYKVSSTWSGTGPEITADSWNGLSKGDPINQQWTSTYPDTTGGAVAPYQTLQAIDVTGAVASGTTTFAFKTNNARTHAIDAYLAITTGESGETPIVESATPEPASTVEGSFEAKALAPSNDWSTTFGEIEGAEEVALNHSAANAAADATVSVYNESTNYRGKSIYLLYDVLVDQGDKLTLEAWNKTDLGTTFILTGNEDGTATASAKVNKGDSVNVGNVVCGTWYRVLIEIPQNNNEGATNTGDATYTIYRIDPADPTKVSEVAVTKAGLTPRNLSSKAATEIKATIVGAPYIDNGVAFVAAQGLSLIEEAPEPETPATPEPYNPAVDGSYIDLLPSGATKLSDFGMAEGETEVVLNHSDAKAAITGDLDAYNTKGGSIYAIYDIYVDEGDKFTLESRGSSDLGTTFVIEGTENGAASVYALVNKGDKVSLGTLSCGTWYRAFIEVPQTKVDESTTNTGDATFIIYRIDPDDPSKVKEIALKKTGLTPRNLSGKGMTKFAADVSGAPYIDNGVVFAASAGYEPELPSVWTLYKAVKAADGTLTSVTIETITDPASVTLGANEYLWNENLTPYATAE